MMIVIARYGNVISMAITDEAPVQPSIEINGKHKWRKRARNKASETNLVPRNGEASARRD